MPQLIVLAIATSSSGGCATASFRTTACPAVVDYDQPLLDRAAEELDALPTDSALDQMLRDYGVMREQTRACRRL
jgi:type IV pilus biogenesis protein CpaD/CtpE